ncbi:unnamed protein product [Lymnaea stagnalis]|uniref:MADF domain-containing protein n=1 Tax=Lymnaea stagnalis TaxID=6523 RepID=A0AAV2IIN6_LYMST
MPKGNREVYSLLIQEVQSRECLYVPSHPHYHDRHRLDAEWAEIGQILGVSGPSAKKTWQNLRSSYSRCLASVKTNSSGVIQKSTWYLKEQMDFLREYMTYAPAYEPADDFSSSGSHIHFGPDDLIQSSDELVDSYIKKEEREHEDSTNGSAASSSFLSAINQIIPVPKKPKISSSTSVPVTDAILKFIASDVDDDLQFFKGILPTVKQLNSTNNRRFKHAISNYLFQMLEAQENPEEPAPKVLQIASG